MGGGPTGAWGSWCGPDGVCSWGWGQCEILVCAKYLALFKTKEHAVSTWKQASAGHAGLARR